jgi:hypothetical protein
MKIYGIKMLKNQIKRLKSGIRASLIQSKIYFSTKNLTKTNQSCLSFLYFYEFSAFS